MSPAETPVETKQPGLLPGSRDYAVAVALALVSLLVYGWLAGAWKMYGIFRQYNILFDADPNSRLIEMANGWDSGEGFAHPFFGLLFALPLRAVVAVAGKLYSVGDPVSAREALALWIGPLCSALRVAVAYVCGRFVGGSTLGAVGLALLTGFSTSSVVFGALSEHHPVSALILTALFTWAVAVHMGIAKERDSVWLFFMIAAAAITITNIVAAVAVYFGSRIIRRHPFVPTVTRTAVLAIVAGIVAILMSLVSHRLMKVPDSTDKTASFASSYTRKPDLDRVIRFPVTLANALVGPVPAVMPNSLPVTRPGAPEHEIDVQFTYDAAPLTFWTALRTLAILGFAVVGAWTAWRAEPRLRGVIAGAVLVLAFNGLFHTLWGTEWILYSLHWHSAFLMLPAGWLIRQSRTGAAFLLGLGVVCVVNSAYVIQSMLQVLGQSAR